MPGSWEICEQLPKPSGPSHVKDWTDYVLDCARMRRDLIQHFNLEEQNGYMDIFKKREPRLARSVDKLANEHQQIRQSLDSLLTEAKVASR